MGIEAYLREMTLIPALSGHEQKMYDYMEKVFLNHGLEVTSDVFGNCIAKTAGTDPNADRIMIFGHMDQLGFLVKKIEDDGFIKLERMGGISEKVLPGLAMQIETRDGTMAEGIIGVKSHHITPPEEKYMVDKYQSLYVDIGAKDYQEVLNMGIDVGSPVAYKPNYQKMAGDRVYATSLDNRIACAILLHLSDRIKSLNLKNDIFLVGTVQEEYNLRGAMMAARTVKPAIAIALDVAVESSTPDTKGQSRTALGKGPVMSLYNFHGRGTLNGTIPHPAMVRLVEKSAEVAGIMIQRSAGVGLLTDLSYIQLEGAGVMSIDIGVPCRYIHSPVESCDLKDIAQTADLLIGILNNIKTLEKRR